MTPTDISVVGPMARHAEDLALAMGVLAGPDLLAQPAWRVDLAPPRHRRLGGFRVGVWTGPPLSEVDDSVVAAFDAAAAALRKTGATVDETARPPIADEEQQRLFMLLLRAATASRLSEPEFERQQAIAAAIADGDTSARAAVARGATLSHRAWGVANEARTKLRYRWREFFQQFDVLLAPIGATAAFRHDQNPDRDARTLPVNGKKVSYNDQLFWAGPASLSYLPATAAPLGLTKEGLPVGCQIIGAEGEDLTTIEFARLLAEEIGGFVPPPGFA